MQAARGAIWSNAQHDAETPCERQWELLAGLLDLVPAVALERPIRVGGWTVADLSEHLREQRGVATAATDTTGGPAPQLVEDRCIEGVVHLLDMAAAVPELGAVPDPQALKTSVRALLADLVAAAPGRSVEVRVPPYAAVQCVAGPRHTRGTPPNVVETDAVTWVELAAGRLEWSAAIAEGRVRASGERADIAALLPVRAVH